ncbi:tetratricopeptide repeat protein [bacterium]|nr:tetratricopeptide repeat protein [bacterium]
MKKHYSSKELRQAMKEDELEELLERSTSWFRRYQKHLTLAGLIVVAAGVVYLIYANYQHSRLEQAGDLYGRAVQHLAQKNYQEAAATFDSVVRDFGGTGAAVRAEAAAAQAYFQAGDYDNALERFTRLASRRDAGVAAQGVAGIGLVLEAQQKYTEAAEHYRQELERNPGGPLSEMWRLRLARCLEHEGRTDEAIAAYEAIDRESSFRDEADRRLLWLKAQPALAQR